MKKILLLLLLVSCSSQNLVDSSDNEVLNFNKELTFEEFKRLLVKYNEVNKYPDISK